MLPKTKLPPERYRDATGQFVASFARFYRDYSDEIKLMCEAEREFVGSDDETSHGALGRVIAEYNAACEELIAHNVKKLVNR